MADTSLRSRLQRLFSTNVIVRNVGGKKLRVADTSRTQSYKKGNLIDRYQKIFSGFLLLCQKSQLYHSLNNRQ